ncbi:hypothetical protein [Asticcacaulis sp.]|jgi:hypothetical protein|uniref:hypothetical protein n=1 Tax=Asticcacaulis sp. TaxID=1872648 RepID=UPI0031CE2128
MSIARQAHKTHPISEKDDLEQFLKASEAYGKKATRSKASALATLQRIGILTRSGKLSSKYKK